jgi:hypothetical protein
MCLFSVPLQRPLSSAHRHLFLSIRWENLEIFSQSQLRTYLVKSYNYTFRGVNRKIL